MMNSFQNSVKYLRQINIKTAINTLKECKLSVQNFPKSKLDLSLVRRLDFSKAKTISFSPSGIGLEIRDERTVGKIHQDPLSYIPIVNPRSILPLIESNWHKGEIGLPSDNVIEKHAIRLIVIRRKKMKKHQRRKLWKRMRHRWARIRQRRRQIKEKIFQNELLAMVKQANEFSAEQYVAGKLQRANNTPLPTRWKHKRLPQFIIRQLMGIDKKINYKHTDVYKA